MYVFVRTDLPLADQLVQVGHACHEAGSRFERTAEPCHLVALAVRDADALLQAVEATGVRFAVFWEPDDAMGYTAACSEPLYGDQRRPFRRYRLWSEGELTGRSRPPAR